MRYRVNAPQVIAETIGEETMIVNLATGHYFNLQGAGVDVWGCIEREDALPDIVARLEARYDAADGEIEASVAALVEELEREDLIVPAAGAEAPARDAEPLDAGPRMPFAMPGLAKFTDMQDIILLDPVHEVDPRGWPHAPASA